VPAAAVIPAPRVSVEYAAVKKSVVFVWGVCCVCLWHVLRPVCVVSVRGTV
jgi:hypothetical protein